MQDKEDGDTLSLRDVIKLAGPFALVLIAYFVFAFAGLKVAALHPSVTPIWPPTGLAIAAVLLCGFRIAPAIFVAAFLVNELTLPSIPSSTIIALGNTLEAVTAGLLIRYWAEGTRAFEAPANVIKFIVACMTATALGATIGVTGLILAGHAATDLFVPLWLTWWMGDLAGAIVVAPCLILWTRHPPRTPAELNGTVTTYIVGAGIGFVCLSPLFLQLPIRTALGYLVIGPLLWAALKQGPRDTATVAVIISGFAVWGAMDTHAQPVGAPHLPHNFIALLVFILGLTIPSLVLAAEVIKKSEAENIRAQQDLEARILWRASMEAATGGSLEDVLADCLEQICKVANWQIGHIYLPDRIGDTELLYPSSIWYFESKKFESLAPTTAHIAMRKGQGLPGRVWASEEPQFLPDISRVSDFPRKNIMLDRGIRSAFGFPVFANGRIQAVVEFFFSAQQSPNPRLLRIIENIGNQLGRVLERQCAHEQEIAMRQALDSLTTAVFFIDSTGRVLSMNQTGEKLLESTSVLKMRNNQELVPTDRESAAEFARAIDCSAKGQTGAVEGPLTIASPDERSAGLIITLLPLEKSKLADLCGTPNASLAVFVQDSSISAPNAASAIAKHYGLTPGELRVLEVVSANGSVKEIAALLNVGETTIKTHLQHIFHKTGTHKRSELIELLTRSAPPLRFS